MNIYGTDINSEWTLTEHGDLKTINGTDNLAQAITNRLSCQLNNLQLYYNQYGSLLTGFLGWKRNERTLEFIRIELGNRLEQETRIQSYEIGLQYNEQGEVEINLNLTLKNGEDMDLNLVLNENGNVEGA